MVIELKIDKTVIRKRIKEKFKTIENFSKYVDIPRTTINFILKNGIGSSNYDMVNRILKALDIYTSEESSFTLDKRSIKLINMFALLDDMGKHTVESVAETEYRRINNPHSSDALIAAYGSISSTKPLSDDEKLIFELIQNIREKHSTND